MSLLDGAGPRTTLQSPLRWPGSPEWKLDYANPARLSREEIERRTKEFAEQKRIAARIRSG
jgi:hypothetical protein